MNLSTIWQMIIYMTLSYISLPYPLTLPINLISLALTITPPRQPSPFLILSPPLIWPLKCQFATRKQLFAIFHGRKFIVIWFG